MENMQNSHESVDINQLSQKASKELGLIIAQAGMNAHNTLANSFDTVRLSHMRTEIENRILEFPKVSEALNLFLNGDSVFDFGICLCEWAEVIDDQLKYGYKTYGFESLNDRYRELIFMLAFYCVYKYGKIDGRNWEGEGPAIQDSVPDDINSSLFFGLVEDPLEITSLLDIGNESFLDSETNKEIDIIYSQFLEYLTSASQYRYRLEDCFKYVDMLDIEVYDPSRFPELNDEQKLLWNIFIRDHIQSNIASNE